MDRNTAVVLAIVLGLGISVAVTVPLLLLPSQPPVPPPPEPPKDVSEFTFAAAGDFGGPGEPDLLALAQRATAADASFMLALGDLGYTTDEPGWCASIRKVLPHIVVVAGNHDVGESSGGDIAEYVRYCPFPLNASVVGGPGAPGDGYGYEYYFDYPAPQPLARIILIAAGLEGSMGYDYGPDSAHRRWVVEAVQDAKAQGIPWVVVGLHKQCITAGGKDDCDVGQGIFDALVELKVDLILQAHDHVYERSKQLALSEACPSVVSGGQFDPDCLVDDGGDGEYAQGGGSVVVVQGTGGAALHSVQLDGSDPELGYFVEVMGEDGSTQRLASGFGSVLYNVTETSIQVETDFCPPGESGSTGACAVPAGARFGDRFVLVAPDAGGGTQETASLDGAEGEPPSPPWGARAGGVDAPEARRDADAEGGLPRHDRARSPHF